MAVETTYTALRENLSSFLDQVSDDREVVIVHRRGAPDVAMVSADELASWMETAYLLRSPANARRLLDALDRVNRGEGTAMTLDELRQSVGSNSETLETL